MGKFRDLTGMRFGRLTVVRRAEDYISPSGKHRIRWLCDCDCGNSTTVLGENLGKTTYSCGCFNKERASARMKKFNTYDLSGKYGIGYTSKGEEFYFDLEDYDKIKKYYWYKNDQGYVLAYTQNKTLRMHKLFVEGQYIDHINSNTSDNRRSNLRVVNKSQNSMNRGLQSNNASGATGVYWHKQSSKWVAFIQINRKHIHLGSFENFEDAVKARKDGEEKYFGEFSYDNSQSYTINNERIDNYYEQKSD